MCINKIVIKNLVLILLGALIAAVGLQFFLIPNSLLDGGIVGLSIVGAHLSGLPLGAFLIILNLPFVYLGFKKFGSMFAILSAVGIVSLSILSELFHHSASFTSEPILAAVFGGLIVGVGVGLVIRYGGTLDGTDIVAILINKRTSFTTGEAIMFMNIFILSASGFIFGWDNAMYSLIAYFIAHKAIDVTVEGLDESRIVWVLSDKYKDIGAEIYRRIGRKVTYVNGMSDESAIANGLMFSVITRMEERKLKEAVIALDPDAFIVTSNAHEIAGKNFVD